MKRAELAVMKALLYYHVRYLKIFPFHATLAARAEMSPGNLRKILPALKARGYVEVIRTGRHAAEYVITAKYFAEQMAHSGRTQGALRAHSNDSHIVLGSLESYSSNSRSAARFERKPPRRTNCMLGGDIAVDAPPLERFVSREVLEGFDEWLARHQARTA